MTIAPVGTYTIAKQTFLNSVINKIGKQEFSSQAYTNPLKRLKGEFLENAHDIEEIYVGKATSGQFDDTGAGVLDRVKPNVFTQYHTNTLQHAYKVTVQDKEVRKGFTSKNGITQIANQIVQSMNTSYELDEYKDVCDTVKALCMAKTVNNTIEVAPVTNDITAKDFCKKVKKVIPKMGEWNSKFSAKENFAKPKNLILMLDSDLAVDLNMEYLASLFNMSVAELNDTTKIEVPDLMTKLGDNQIAVLFDERCIKVNPCYYNCESIRNTRGKFTNYDLATETLLSYTDWYQFAVFKVKTT